MTGDQANLPGLLVGRVLSASLRRGRCHRCREQLSRDRPGLRREGDPGPVCYDCDLALRQTDLPLDLD